MRDSWYSNPLYIQAKHWLFEFLFLSGLLGIFRFLRRHDVLIAIYHDVLPAGFPEDNPLFGMTASVEQFAWQLDYFKKHYNPISFEQFSDWYFHGCELPSRPVLITLDDGHRNNLRFALPVLQQKQIRALCFVLTGEMGACRRTWFEDAYYRLVFSTAKSWTLKNGECWSLLSRQQRAAACARFFVLCRTLSEREQQEELSSLRAQLPVTEPGAELADRFEFLSPDDVRRLSESGIEIGSHSISHPFLGALQPEDARREIAGSKSVLERMLGKPVRAFAYPFGAPRLDFTSRDEALVEESNYSFAFAGEGGFATRSSNRFRMPRIGIGRMTRAQFAIIVAGADASLKRMLALGRRGE